MYVCVCKYVLKAIKIWKKSPVAYWLAALYKLIIYILAIYMNKSIIECGVVLACLLAMIKINYSILIVRFK